MYAVKVLNCQKYIERGKSLNDSCYLFFMPTRDQPADVDGAEGEGVNKIASPRSTIFCEIIKSLLI
jgi:hypothetical protein